MNNKKKIYDSGQSEYFVTAHNAPEPIKALSRYAERILQRNQSFSNRISKKLYKSEFDTIILAQGQPSVFNLEGLSLNYQLCFSSELAMPLTQQSWIADVYRLKGDCPSGIGG